MTVHGGAASAAATTTEATETAKAAAKPSAATEASSEPATERTDTTRPPASTAPASAEASSPSHTPRNEVDDEDQHDERNHVTAAGTCPPRSTPLHGPNALERDVASLGDTAHDALRTREQPFAIFTSPERGRHDVAARLSGEAVGDEALEFVADLDAHHPVLDRHHNQKPVVATALPDPSTVVLEHLHRVLVDVRVGRDGLDCCHDDDVAGRLLKRPDERLHLARARVVDDVREVVDRLRQLGRERLRLHGNCQHVRYDYGKRRSSHWWEPPTKIG